MENSSAVHKEPVMGRADVLLKFLQLIGKDRPKDIEPYIRDLYRDTEERPLVDQIVDSIIAGNPEFYEKYEQARRDVGPRNPYTSTEEEEKQGYEEALGIFILKWTKFENIIRNASKSDQNRDRVPIMHFIDRSIPDKYKGELEYVRRLRNEVVHGIKRPSPEVLKQASDFMDHVIGKVPNFHGNTGGNAEPIDNEEMKK